MYLNRYITNENKTTRTKKSTLVIGSSLMSFSTTISTPLHIYQVIVFLMNGKEATLIFDLTLFSPLVKKKLITIINRVGTKKHQLNGVEYTSTAIGIELIGRCRHLPPPILIFLHCNTPISSISQIHSESLYKNN